ncbi:MAG: hypothetical protein P8014_17765 [Acidihalobacter sp.]|uniref:hypothetical protein n=1 Tax=Acidihalobacter sp. TaxID=1872108 RepID=UPI00307DE923
MHTYWKVDLTIAAISIFLLIPLVWIAINQFRKLRAEQRLGNVKVAYRLMQRWEKFALAVGAMLAGFEILASVISPHFGSIAHGVDGISGGFMVVGLLALMQRLDQVEREHRQVEPDGEVGESQSSD